MPPELLEQLGLDALEDTDVDWPEDHDALGPSQHAVREPRLDRAQAAVHDDR
jgi:hypothetical protein